MSAQAGGKAAGGGVPLIWLISGIISYIDMKPAITDSVDRAVGAVGVGFGTSVGGGLGAIFGVAAGAGLGYVLGRKTGAIIGAVVGLIGGGIMGIGTGYDVTKGWIVDALGDANNKPAVIQTVPETPVPAAGDKIGQFVVPSAQKELPRMLAANDTAHSLKFSLKFSLA